DDRLLARVPGELVIVLQLEAAKTPVVDTRVADHGRPDAPLRILATLLGIGEHAREALLQEERRLNGIGEALDVDELAALVAQRRVERVRVDAEETMRRDRDAARVRDLLGVRVDRRRLLADRELDARAVEDRAAAGRNLVALLVLAVRE